MGDEKTQAILTDYRSADIPDRLRAMLAFLEKMTLHPDELTAADADAARRAGCTPDEIRDAIYVCAAFNAIDRIADTMGFRLQDDKALRKSALRLWTHGYLL